jgi:predicted phosphohydrolase
MTVKLEQPDFQRLVEILQGLPEFANERYRRRLLTAAFTGVAHADRILADIDLEGTPRGAAVELVRFLGGFGQVSPGREALGALLQEIGNRLGEGDQQHFIRSLFSSYTLSTSAVPLPTQSRPGASVMEPDSHRSGNVQPITWLHLSDLHLGGRGKELWWQVHEEFETSLKKMGERIGPPDLVLLTGDLTFKGAADEFERFNRFLDSLLDWLPGTDPEPLIIPVPGNHDLARPQGMDALRYKVLEHYGLGNDDEDVAILRRTLWDQVPPEAVFFEPLFGNYQRWFEKRIQPQFARKGISAHRSHFPGDLCVEVNLNGHVPLGIVGLNSTWIQYKGGDFEGKLELPTQQFQAALATGGHSSPLGLFRHHPHALLLMHHPPSWLSTAARETFLETIYPPQRFSACLYGHRHKGRSEAIGIAGGQSRYYFQSPSLFGLEHYGTRRETRAMGYAWGRIDARGEVRLWPLKRVKRGGGEAVFDWDQEFSGNLAEGVVLRPAHKGPC